MDVNGLFGGFVGEGASTVIPAKVFAKVSMRLVPDQDPQKIIDATQAFIESLVPAGLQAELSAGHAAPGVVVSLDGLADLGAETASGPQLLALMQARVVAGPADFAQRVSRGLKDIFVQTRDPGSIAAIGAARGREGLDHGAEAWAWSPRWRHGGLHDLEILVRALQLCHAAIHPDVLSPSIPGALAGLAAGSLLAEPVVRDLLGAHHLLRQTETILAISMERAMDLDDAPQELRVALARAAGLENFGQLEKALNDASERVRASFEDLVKEHGRTPG